MLYVKETVFFLNIKNKISVLTKRAESNYFRVNDIYKLY